MDIYYCPKCKTKFLSCDLIRTQCSENFVGSYMIDYCPKCMAKVSFVKLEKEKNNEGNIA